MQTSNEEIKEENTYPLKYHHKEQPYTILFVFKLTLFFFPFLMMWQFKEQNAN